MLKVKWKKVIYADILNVKYVCRWIDLCNGTMFRIVSFFTDTLKGDPRGGFFVAIERVGAYLFPISDHYKTDYVSEKLCVPPADAASIADWMNAQLCNDVLQQGNYKKSYLDAIEPVIYAGERAYLPLVPEIISEE